MFEQTECNSGADMSILDRSLHQELTVSWQLLSWLLEALNTIVKEGFMMIITRKLYRSPAIVRVYHLLNKNSVYSHSLLQ